VLPELCDRVRYRGQRHHHDALRWFGFDCFDAVFDQHRYDHLADWQERTLMAVQILRQNWHAIPDIYHANQDALLHNQVLCRSVSFRNQLRHGLRQHDLIKEQG